MMGLKRESKFTQKFGRDNPWGGHRRRTFTLKQIVLAVSGIAATMMLCGALLILASMIKIKSVTITGNHLYSTSDILEASGLVEGEGYFDFDPSTVSDKLCKELPLLRDAKIRRKLNGGVTVTVTEENGFYYTLHNQNYYLLAKDGLRVLMAASDDAEFRGLNATYLGLPMDARLRVGETLTFAYRPYAENESDTGVASGDETKSAEKQYEYVTEWLKTYRESELFDRTVGIDLSDPYEVYVVLEGKIKIIFSTPDDLEEKITSAVRAMKEEGAYEVGEGAEPTLIINVKDASLVTCRPGFDAQWPSWVG